MPLKNSTIQSFKQNLIDAKRAETLKRVQYEKRRESENIGILFPESNRLKDPPVKTIRDLMGRMVLFEDESTGMNLQTPNQSVKIALDGFYYDQLAIDKIIDNNIEELLPPLPEIPNIPSIPERIIEFFGQYEELRDYITGSLADTEMDHQYLVDISKTYLPGIKDKVSYNGDLVDSRGEVMLKSPNTLEIKEGVFLQQMVGGKVRVHAVEARTNPVILLESMYDVIELIILQYNQSNPTRALDIEPFMDGVKSKLELKYIHQVYKDDLDGIMSEIYEELETQMFLLGLGEENIQGDNGGV